MKYGLFLSILIFSILQSDTFVKGAISDKNITIAPPKSFFDSHGEVILIKDSVERGRELFMNKIKKACGMNGIEFSAKHTQVEWEMIKNLCSFKHEAEKICPHLKDMSEKWVDDLYEFTYEYAKGSGKIPSCKEILPYKTAY